MEKCFVICPIGDEETEIRRNSDKLLKYIISPVCQSCGLEAIRIDNENSNTSITDDILKHLQEDKLVIADLTDSNPNTFYEMGYRAALGLPSIHLMRKGPESIPFDVSTIRTLPYDLLDLDSVEEVKERLEKTIKSIDFNTFNTSTSDNKSSGNNSNMVNMQILQEIYKLQDSITQLSANISAKDSAAVSVLADKLAVANTKSPEAAIIETFLSKMIDAPDQMLKFIDTANKMQQKTKY